VPDIQCELRTRFQISLACRPSADKWANTAKACMPFGRHLVPCSEGVRTLGGASAPIAVWRHRISEHANGMRKNRTNSAMPLLLASPFLLSLSASSWRPRYLATSPCSPINQLAPLRAASTGHYQDLPSVLPNHRAAQRHGLLRSSRCWRKSDLASASASAPCPPPPFSLNLALCFALASLNALN
jgi:hypothetical protein